MGKKTWNNRILKRTIGDVDYYGIYEVHYDDDKPIMCTMEPKLGLYESVEEIIEDIEIIRKDIDKHKDDVLEYDDF